MASSDQTYLQLVNDAIRESGVSLDSLTSSNFASTTDQTQIKFQRWVAQAYEELQQERFWEFMHKQASIVVKPRIYIEEEAGAVLTPSSGRYLIGQDTEASLVSTGTPSLLSGAWASGTAKAYVEYEDLDGVPKYNELVDLYDTDGTSLLDADFGRVKGVGRYFLETEVSDLLEADYSSFKLQSTGGSSTQDNTDVSDPYPIQQITWDDYVRNDWLGFSTQGRPYHFVEAPDGAIQFWPHLNQEYVLHFQYQCKPTSLDTYDDTVTNIPAQYQDAIFWRAVMYYAEYDVKSPVFLRAQRRYRFFKKRMEHNLMPPMSFKGKSDEL